MSEIASILPRLVKLVIHESELSIDAFTQVNILISTLLLVIYLICHRK
jgi:hypothetical protein